MEMMEGLGGGTGATDAKLSVSAGERLDCQLLGVFCCCFCFCYEICKPNTHALLNLQDLEAMMKLKIGK